MHLAIDFVCGPKSDVHQIHWISQGLLSLVGQKRQLLNCEMIVTSQQVMHQATTSLEMTVKAGGLRYTKDGTGRYFG